MSTYQLPLVDLVNLAAQALASVEKRARTACKRATGQEALRPGMGSPAHWAREADRLDALARRYAVKLADLQARLDAETNNPDPF